MFGAIIVVLVLPLMLLLLRNQPGALPEFEIRAASCQATEVVWSVRGALARPNFRRLSAGYFGCGFTMAMVQTHFPAHAVQSGMTSLQAATAFGLMGVLAIFGTVSTGTMSDRFGRRALLASVYALRMSSLLLMAWAPNSWVLMTSAVLFGLSWTATGPLTSMLTGELFGLRNMGVLFGAIFFFHQVGATLGAYFGGALFDRSGAYLLSFLLGAAVLATSSFVSHRLRERLEPVSVTQGRTDNREVIYMPIPGLSIIDFHAHLDCT